MSWWESVQPAFWRRLKARYRAALIILILVGGWLATGLVFHPHQGQSAIDAQAKTGAEVPRVKVRLLEASQRDAMLTVHGTTQALNAVDVRSQIEGVVQKINFQKGEFVKTGHVLCEIQTNDRAAKLDQARALVAQTEKQHDVDMKLAEDGFRSKTQVAQSAASLEAAKASQRTQEIELANTQIRAPFDGFVDDRYVEVGDYMKSGDKCALLIAPEPFLAVGALSEDDVGKVKVGDAATATLITGETVAGKVRFIADRADATTRTFRIEVQLPNPDGKLRDGISADIHIPARQVMAQHISSGILVLDDSGVVGVRTLDTGVVHFVPVHIISDGPDGTWVTGLPNHVTVITVGQEFVSDGEHAVGVPDRSATAS